MKWEAEKLDLSERMMACRDPTHFRQARKKMRPGPTARSLNTSLLFAQRDGAWIDRLVLVIRIKVDHQVSIPCKLYGVADDLAVKSRRPVVAIDRDR